MLIIVIAIAGFAFGQEAAQNRIVETLQGLIGQESSLAIQAMIQNASNKPKTGIVSTVVGVIALLFGAGGVVGPAQGIEKRESPPPEERRGTTTGRAS